MHGGVLAQESAMEANDSPVGAARAADEPAPSQRSDARRNRDRIIQAAGDVLARKGLGSGLNEIARHAGVGVGTVYRHFPRREELIEAVLRDRIAALGDLLARAAEAPSAWDALEAMFRGAVEMNIENRALRDAMLGDEAASGRLMAQQFALAGPLEALMARARDEGKLRSDVTIADIAMLMLMLVEFGQRSQAVAPGAYRRYVDFVVGSLRRDAATAPLTVALEDADARRIARGWPSQDH